MEERYTWTDPVFVRRGLGSTLKRLAARAIFDEDKMALRTGGGNEVLISLGRDGTEEQQEQAAGTVERGSRARGGGGAPDLRIRRPAAACV